MNESTVRRLKTKYLEKLEETVKDLDSDSEKDEVADTLPKCKQGRPLLLGEDLHAAVQEYVETQRAIGTAINSTVVMAAAEGIISMRDVSKLVESGGHIDITKSWAKSLLN